MLTKKLLGIPREHHTQKRKQKQKHAVENDSKQENATMRKGRFSGERGGIASAFALVGKCKGARGETRRLTWGSGGLEPNTQQ
jgi:hypothetical protein